MENGFVYFIKMEETREIKIGFTVKNPKERLKDIVDPINETMC